MLPPIPFHSLFVSTRIYTFHFAHSILENEFTLHVLFQVAEVRLDNLQDAELQALLDEVVQYRGKRDGEKGTELFQVPFESLFGSL